MDAYIFRGALHCERCASEIWKELTEDTGDSETHPQGPYYDGGGEADSPQHCDTCRVFLRNPLTDDGLAYVKTLLNADAGDKDVLDAWAKFYELPSHRTLMRWESPNEHIELKILYGDAFTLSLQTIEEILRKPYILDQWSKWKGSDIVTELLSLGRTVSESEEENRYYLVVRLVRLACFDICEDPEEHQDL